MASLEGMEKLKNQCARNLKEIWGIDVSPPSKKVKYGADFYKQFSDDATKTSTPVKKVNNGNKLTRNEGRMFNERIIFLNKSTTKYAVIGVDPLTFTPNIKICDRSSGSYLPITHDELPKFFHLVKVLLHEDNDDEEEEEDLGKPSSISIIPLSKNVWKFESIAGNGVAVHTTTLEKLLRIKKIINNEVRERISNGTRYREVMDTFRRRTVEIDERGILAFLRERYDDTYSLDSDVADDLLCNHDYLITLQNYNEGFFRRKIIL